MGADVLSRLIRPSVMDTLVDTLASMRAPWVSDRSEYADRTFGVGARGGRLWRSVFNFIHVRCPMWMCARRPRSTTHEVVAAPGSRKTHGHAHARLTYRLAFAIWLLGVKHNSQASIYGQLYNI